MSLAAVTAKITEKVALAAGLAATVKFDFGDEGLVFIDAGQNPAVISHADGEADVTFETSLSTLQDILSGAQDPNIAFMLGKLKVKGSMALAMKLSAILED